MRGGSCVKTLELLLRIFAAKNWHPHRLETPHEGGAMVSGAAGGEPHEIMLIGLFLAAARVLTISVGPYSWPLH